MRLSTTTIATGVVFFGGYCSAHAIAHPVERSDAHLNADLDVRIEKPRRAPVASILQRDFEGSASLQLRRRADTWGISKRGSAEAPRPIVPETSRPPSDALPGAPETGSTDATGVRPVGAEGVEQPTPPKVGQDNLPKQEVDGTDVTKPMAMHEVTKQEVMAADSGPLPELPKPEVKAPASCRARKRELSRIRNLSGHLDRRGDLGNAIDNLKSGRTYSDMEKLVKYVGQVLKKDFGVVEKVKVYASGPFSLSRLNPTASGNRLSQAALRLDAATPSHVVELWQKAVRAVGEANAKWVNPKTWVVKPSTAPEPQENRPWGGDWGSLEIFPEKYISQLRDAMIELSFKLDSSDDVRDDVEALQLYVESIVKEIGVKIGAADLQKSGEPLGIGKEGMDITIASTVVFIDPEKKYFAAEVFEIEMPC